MQAFNLLIDRVAADEAYLTNTLTKAAKQDPFTGKLSNKVVTSGVCATSVEWVILLSTNTKGWLIGNQ
jgi:hypothetical protein